MSIVTQFVRQDGNQVVIAIKGRFDFSVHDDFRKAYKSSGGLGTEYRIDLSNTEYMDSSALGMLLMLREHAGEGQASVSLLSPRDAVRKVLEIANFDQLFQIQ